MDMSRHDNNNISSIYNRILKVNFKENLMNITDYGPLKETKSHFDSDFLYNTYLCSIPLWRATICLTLYVWKNMEKTCTYAATRSAFMHL